MAHSIAAARSRWTSSDIATLLTADVASPAVRSSAAYTATPTYGHPSLALACRLWQSKPRPTSVDRWGCPPPGSVTGRIYFPSAFRPLRAGAARGVAEAGAEQVVEMRYVIEAGRLPGQFVGLRSSTASFRGREPRSAKAAATLVA
jgi:hypothetical protein